MVFRCNVIRPLLEKIIAENLKRFCAASLSPQLLLSLFMKWISRILVGIKFRSILGRAGKAIETSDCYLTADERLGEETKAKIRTGVSRNVVSHCACLEAGFFPLPM
jgi:hypothetical protein